MIVDRDAAAASAPPVEGARPLRELAAGDPAALRLLDGFWLVPAAQLLDAGHGTVITAEGHGYDAERGELWFAGETAEAVLLEMDARRRSLADEAEELTGRAAAAAHAAAEAAEAAGAAEAAFAAVAHLRERTVDPVVLGALVEVAATVAAALERARAATTRLEEPLAARLTIGAQQAGELGAELRRLSTLEADAAREAADSVARAQAAEVVVARLGGSLDDLPPDGIGVARATRRGSDVAARARRGSRGRGSRGRRSRARRRRGAARARAAALGARSRHAGPPARRGRCAGCGARPRPAARRAARGAGPGPRRRRCGTLGPAR